MGFETVVRPMVFPNIRPAPARTLPPVSNPEQGFCVISGASGQAVALTYSWNASSSKSRPVETERRVDVMRVYQKNDDGTVNKNNFVDLDVANRIRTKGGKGPSIAGVPIAGVRVADPLGVTEQSIQAHYQRMQEGDNIELRSADIIRVPQGDIF